MNTSVAQDRFVYYFIPFSSSGVTIRIDALIGGIRCYASDTDRRPSSRSYVWTLVITDYDDSFLDPSTLGRTPGSSVYIALQGINAVNTFTMNTTIGDTSIEGIEIRLHDNCCAIQVSKRAPSTLSFRLASFNLSYACPQM